MVSTAASPHRGPGLVTLWVSPCWPWQLGWAGKKTSQLMVAQLPEHHSRLTIKMAHKWNVHELKRFAQICTHTGISDQTCQQCSGSLTNDTYNILHCFFASFSPHGGATHIKLGCVNQWLGCTLASTTAPGCFPSAEAKNFLKTNTNHSLSDG